MKIYSHLIQTRLRFKSKWIIPFCFILFLIQNVDAQITETLIEEIEVADGATIVSNIPSAIDIMVNGTMKCNNTKNRYSINGKNNDIRLNILKELIIETWDKNTIKQETIISIKTESDDTSKKLMKQLKINLKNGPDNRIVIDNNVNISSFHMKNSFFKSDDCKIQLDNGEMHTIEYISIETRLSIPKSCNLAIKGNKECIIRIGELEGNIDLELKYAEVYGRSVKNLRASFRSCYAVHFSKVNIADISSSNSNMVIQKAGLVKIGNQPLNDACNLPHVTSKRSHSAQSKYIFGSVENLSVSDSTNDDFNINQVLNLKVKKTSYTDFKIDLLTQSLNAEAKSSDLIIANISNQFSEINIKNSLSTIDLSFNEDANYLLQVDQNNYVEGNHLLSNPKKVENGKNIFQVGESGKGGNIFLKCDRCKFNIQ